MSTQIPIIEPDRKVEKTSLIGKHVLRLDGESKVTGAVSYTDDFPFEGYYAEVIRSNVPHGEIVSISTEVAESIPGVIAVVTGEDLENADWISPYVGPAFRDQPVLAIGKVRYVGEPVAAVIAERPDIAAVASTEVVVECKKLQSVTDVVKARKENAPLLHESGESAAIFEDLAMIHHSEEPNVAYAYELNVGDIEKGFEEADVVFEKNYATPMVQHVHLEPFVTTASYNAAKNSFRIVTGNQTPHFVRREVARIFGIPSSKVEVEVPQMGGAFGSKTYVRIEPLVAALSRVVKAPVKLRQTSSESFDTSVRDGTQTRVKTGVTHDGVIIAQEVEVIWDSGAYADISPRKVKKAGYTAPGAYDIPNVRVISKSVYTNKPPGVAYRGFGVAQTAWAVESHIDDIAREIGMDPVELRIRNITQDGGTYNGVAIGIHGAPQCLQAIVDEVDWFGMKLKQPSKKHIKKGRGIAVTLKTTITPSTSEAIVLLDADGSVNVITGGTEIGQGIITTLAQITAEGLGIGIEYVNVNTPNTNSAPFNTSTTSSRSTFHLGNAVLKAVDELKEQLVELASEDLEIEKSDIIVEDGFVKTSVGDYSIGEVVASHFVGGGGTLIGKGYFSTKAGRENRYESAFWMTGATYAEVSVDTRTGKYSIDKWVNSADCGKAIDPVRCEGQILGAAVQALGHTMSEEMVFESGQQVNKSLLDYKVPAIGDVPKESKIIIVESGDPNGPYGAKGVGESNTVTVPPAIGNAIRDACGARVRELPITPDKVLRGIEEASECIII
jgi:CO/xanthine dehydrogenase Mo-binding subunit